MAGVSSSRKLMVGVLLRYRIIQRDKKRGWGAGRGSVPPCFLFSFEQGSIMRFERLQLSVSPELMYTVSGCHVKAHQGI